MSDLRTCRFCGMSNYEYNHPAVKSAWVKYGTRHSAHLQCAVAKLGAEGFLKRLTTWQINQLPAFEIHSLGIEDAVRAELAMRPTPKHTYISPLGDTRNV